MRMPLVAKHPTPAPSPVPAVAIRMATRLSLVGLLACSYAASASAQMDLAARSALATLEQRSGAPLRTSLSPVTGFATFIGAERGHPIALPVAAAESAQVRAQEFFRLAAPALGLASEKEVALFGVDGPDEVGMEHARYTQTYNDVPVTAAEIVVHLRGADVISANGHTLPGISLDTTPGISAAQARGRAGEVARKVAQTAGHDGNVSLSEPRLEILDVGFFQRRALTGNRLTWFVEATGTALRERIWIDADDGSVALQYSQLTDALNRMVYTANGGASVPGTLVRSEGQGPSGDTDVDDAYDYSGDTYNYFFNEHGRDSYDGAGATLLSTVDWCDGSSTCGGSCPCRNAFWNGVRMTYGDGFPAADDVVGHELTHAVTENSAGLVYCLQSGALNESFSDIFGETIDLTNSGGTDTAGVRWEMGEDIPGIGAIRDMSNPNAYGDPGKVSDSQFICATSCSDPDKGGVHTNSGVPNKAYVLMVDGGSYNGFTVSGIGLTKAGKIQYRALTQYLTSNAIFLDDNDALNQSCQDLIGTAGISTADCDEVTKALQAVEMDGPVCVPAECGNGTTETGEQCDDGNLVDCDGCDSNCVPTGCGNGLAACGEQCDDGNTTDGDGCESDCTLTAGCAFYSATDVPQNIPDLGSTISTISVPASGIVFDVNVVNLAGTHTFVGDLEFHLASPAGTTAIVVDNVCGNDDDFDLDLDDAAGTSIPCPPTDGAAHVPSNPLAALNGPVGAGNWTMSVYDVASFDVGTLDSWGLFVCIESCGNGLSDPGEECDDGNNDDTDGCTSSCTICGNGTTTAPEECDDGDLDSGDGCDANCTATACGNGIATAPEECDDGNSDDSDGCTSSCTLCGNGVVTAPEECDDGNSNDSDLCHNDCTINTAGSCCEPHTLSPGCSDTVCESCVCGADPFCCGTNWDSLCVDRANNECAGSCPCDDPVPTPTPALTSCPATPEAGCPTPGKAILTIKDKAPAGASGSDKLIWKWLKGPAATAADFGDPLTPNNGYLLCLYDDTGLVTELGIPGGGTCDGKPCWKAISFKGFKFKDKARASDGVAKIVAKGGDPGKSKIIVKGAGANLLTPSLPLASTGPVTVQLLRDDAGGCWQTVFTSALKNEADKFKAKQ